MRRQGWVSKKDRLDRLFGYYRQLPPTQPELRSHWVRYLVVLTSGFLETSVGYIYTEYARVKSEQRVGKYVAARLERPVNLGMDRLEQLVRDFDDAWLDELQKHPDFDQIRSSVQSVVSNRHKVAHGDDINTTFSQLEGYYNGVIKLLDILTEQCDRETQPGRITKKDRRKAAGP